VTGSLAARERSSSSASATAIDGKGPPRCRAARRRAAPVSTFNSFTGMGQNSPGTRGSVFSRKRQSALTLRVSRKLFQSKIARLV
jgi:hypothetical protein